VNFFYIKTINSKNNKRKIIITKDIINDGFKILEKDIDELDKTLKKTNVKHSF
jgi:hypothetical protein